MSPNPERARFLPKALSGSAISLVFLHVFRCLRKKTFARNVSSSPFSETVFSVTLPENVFQGQVFKTGFLRHVSGTGPVEPVSGHRCFRHTPFGACPESPSRNPFLKTVFSKHVSGNASQETFSRNRSQKPLSAETIFLSLSEKACFIGVFACLLRPLAGNPPLCLRGV